MKLFVIGGAGFIGSNFCHLVKELRPNWRMFVLDKFTYAANKDYLPDGVLSNKFDITSKADINMLDRSLEDVDTSDAVIVNFAAESHVDNSINDASAFINTNIIGVYNLLEVCRRHSIRMIQISTDEVLGDLPLDGKNKFNINSPLAPNNPYAATKASAETLVRSYVKTHSVNANITRCTNNYGPRQHEEKMIPKSIINLLEDKPVTVYGTGDNIRDWIHVEDHCRGIIQVLEKGVSGETYMFGGNTELSNIDLVKMIIDELGKDDSYINYITDRKGHDLRYAIKKHTPGLIWTPKKKFKEEIGNLCNWYKELANVK